MSENKYTKFMDNDFPLLTRLKERAPGTYKHSQNLVDICTNVATELDLDKDLMRCAALYHDVGKIFNPEWFTENQTEGNLHEEVDTQVSYQIITRHVSDSVLLLSQYDFPNDVMQIVGSHHGSFILLYFWKKAGADEEDKDQYRYPSMPPQDVYSGILMVCDRVEAAAKSLFNAGKLKDAEARKILIDDVLNDLIEDGQLDNLTFKVGKVIKKVLIQELAALYHERIDYDERVDKELEKELENDNEVEPRKDEAR